MAKDFRAHLMLAGYPGSRVDEFIQWHRENPEVWKAFERVALAKAQREGAKHWGAMAFVNSVRWEEELPTSPEHKVNNNWAPFYARVFAIKHPEYAEFFSFRKPKGEDAYEIT
jgi:hypothetical protein